MIDGLRAGVGGTEILRGIDLDGPLAARSTPSWARTARASRRCPTCSWASPATRSPAGRSPSTASTCSPCRRGERAAGRPVPRPAVPDRGARRVAARPAERPLRGRRPRPGRTCRSAHPGRGRAHRLRRAVPRPAAQRRPLRRREEAQRDAPARRARARRSPCSTSSTPASTSTPCGPRPGASRRRPSRPRRGLGVLAITHYSRLLHELRADAVHVLAKGRSSAPAAPSWPRSSRSRATPACSAPTWRARPRTRVRRSASARRSTTSSAAPARSASAASLSRCLERSQECLPPLGEAELERRQREAVARGVARGDRVPAEVLDRDPGLRPCRPLVHLLEADVQLGAPGRGRSSRDARSGPGGAAGPRRGRSPTTNTAAVLVGLDQAGRSGRARRRACRCVRR